MGLKGVKLSKEHREKLSKAKLGKKASEASRAARRAAWTPEKRLKQSLRKTGSTISAATRAKMSAAWTPEMRLRASLRYKGKPTSEEAKRKQSLALRGKKWAPGRRHRERAPKNYRMLTCATCGKPFGRAVWQISPKNFCSRKCHYQDPEFRAKVAMSSGNRIWKEESKQKVRMARQKLIKEGRLWYKFSKPHRLFISLFENKFGVQLVKEYPLACDDGSFRYYDCKIVGSNILFEIDGEYWHSLPQNMKNDKLKDELAARLGYKLFRIPSRKVIEFINCFRLPGEVKVRDQFSMFDRGNQ